MALMTAACLCLGTAVGAEADGEEGVARDGFTHDQRMAWWREARFGMFVHWGIYSVTGGEYQGRKLPNSAEWMMNRGQIPVAEYEKLAALFDPEGFDADTFVRLAKRAGMRYLIFTAKHHDGFSMFHSRVNPFNVVDATPLGRDIVRELVDACQRHGLRFGLYYSQAQDWHHPGGVGNTWDDSLPRVSVDEYVNEKAYPEVVQLLTEYAPISIFWWDTPREMSRESLDKLYATRWLQPGLITNDRLGENYPGDHRTFERRIPTHGPEGVDWEVCMPISGSWGFKRGDVAFKSTETLIRNLVDIASKGGNYLLNVSPTADGTLLLQAVERLYAIGEWMAVNSESIYGTTASPFGRLQWGRCTMKQQDGRTTLYLHVFDWPENGALVVPGLKAERVRCRMLDDGTPVAAEAAGDNWRIQLPAARRESPVTVVKMEIDGAWSVAPVSPMLQADGSILLGAEFAYLHNNEGMRGIEVLGTGDEAFIGRWKDPHAWVEWPVKVARPGTY
ncbi:MAG: glycosyl hydrolase [Verrucomicrobia bacterium]|nr:MAG: glycosyl hydrolase [Verrucomicrobiota bacterium]